jgi:hypothetical protein
MKGNEHAQRPLHIEGSDSDVPEQALIDLALGLGWGASDQARRWALIGQAYEAQMKLRRPAHRPKQDPLTHTDAIRAFAAWQMCWNLRRRVGNPKAHISNRELIRAIQFVEITMSLDAVERLFPERENPDASLSRGKKILGVDKDWNSKVCEEVQRSFTKTTG